MELTTSKLMRDADNTAIHIMGIPSTLLMRNAAKALAVSAMELMGESRTAVIFCSGGNNGGDGVAAAAYMLLRGKNVRVFLVGSREKMTADTKEMERRLCELGGRLENFDEADPTLPELLNEAGVIVDAMFGVGLNRPLEGKPLAAVKMINASPAPAIAADIPSGIEADSGRVLGDAVKCVKTVTFSMAKPGHFAQPGCTFCGKVEVVDIGIPAELLKECGSGIFAVEEKDISLPRREKISYKGSYGRLLTVGGSVGYTGAPVLCAKAAERSGAGLVYLAVPSDIYEITAVKSDGAMPFPLSGDSQGRFSLKALPVIEKKIEECDVCVIGPGMGRSEEITELVNTLIPACGKTMVLDADALFAVAQDISVLKRAAKPPVLTPHDGEFARLMPEQSGDRISDAREFARENECVLVLKGHRTVIAFPDGEVYITQTGNPGMAKGGSGDVLSGVIGAMLCQLPLKKAVITAVWLHGRAGDIACDRLGEYSMTAMDIIEDLPAAAKSVTR